MKKRLCMCYSLIFFLICAIPFGAMFFVKERQPEANEITVVKPELQEDGEWNSEYLKDLSAYMDSNFAGRQTLITANARLMENLVNSSENEKVICGKDGWLFFEETAKDYLGQATISNRQAFAIARNLETMKRGIEKKGGSFFFTIAPNKNSLYGQFMPDRYLEQMQENNYSKLKPYLDTSYYIDLFVPLRESKEILYHKWDSHWNRQGALFVRDVLMERTGRTAISYDAVSAEQRRSHKGDLYEMVYPEGTELDWDVAYDRKNDFIYRNPVRDNDEPQIETKNKRKKENLVMYRDSFGIALLPFMADEYGAALFSKEVPYQMEMLNDYLPGDVIVEIVERNLDTLCETAPVLEAPKCKGINRKRKKAASEVYGKIDLQQEDGHYVVSGAVDHSCIVDETEYLVEIRSKKGTAWYMPFYLDENRFYLRLPEKDVSGEIVEVTLYCQDKERIVKVSGTFCQ